MVSSRDPLRRRLSAVWFADIVGYTRLSATDSPAAVRLCSTFEEICGSVVERHGGRVVKFVADAALAEFSSADAAARAALELQQEFSARTDARLRIGLHLGDVISTADGDVYGDGVNVAARLEEVAQPRQVVVSDDVRRSLRADPGFRLRPLGRRSFRGLPEPYDLYAVELQSSERRLSPPRSDAGRPHGWRERIGPVLASRSGLAAASGLLLCAVLFWALLFSSRTPPAPVLASHVGILVLTSAEASPPRADGATADGLERLLLTSLGALTRIRAIDGNSLLERSRERAVPSLQQLLARTRGVDARYLLLADVVEGEPARVTVDLYAADTGERIFRGVGGDGRESVVQAIERIMLEVIQTVGQREGMDLSSFDYAATSTSSVVALEHLLDARAYFYGEETDRAVAALRRAIAADSLFALAYHRLSMAETWEPRWDYGAALQVVELGLARADRLSPLWVRLLNAQRHFVLRNADSSVTSFQGIIAQHPELLDAWLGLGESLFHYGAYAGYSPAEAGAAFEKVLAQDSAFAPVHFHLVELSLYEGDPLRARHHLAKIPRGSPHRTRYELAVALRFGSPAEQADALRRLESAERGTISVLVTLFARGGFALELADTVSTFLSGPHRTPDDRLRGGQYRLVLLAAQGRWEDGIAAWRAAAGGSRFDRWMVHADLAGYPAAELTRPMYRWADSVVAQGRAPRSGSLSDDAENAFRALVHRATLQGDSAQVEFLLSRLASGGSDPRGIDPLPGALRSSLLARKALLAGDTSRAIRHLEEAVARPVAVTWHQPLTDMAVQRRLLATLARSQGRMEETARWSRSFAENWSLGDVLFLPRGGQ